MSKEGESKIKLIYDFNKEDIYIRLFGEEFVENNKDICKMIIDNNNMK